MNIAEFRVHAEQVVGGRYSRRDPARDDERLDVITRTPDGHDSSVVAAVELQALLRSAGLVGITVPLAYGGRGLGDDYEDVLQEILASYDTPSTRPLGNGPQLAMPTLLRSGTDEQRDRFLPKIASGEERWCQLFSEPDAGSDLVSLRSTAVRVGDRWIVNGQKVWSSYAEGADFGLLLVRTRLDAPSPHSGLTMFILPMNLTGVAVRNLVDMTGGRHFNEVFLTDVSLDDSLVLGEVHAGWQVATGTLGGERSGYRGGSGNGRRERQVTTIGRNFERFTSPVSRQRAVSVIAEERILGWLRERVARGSVCGGHPAVGSMIKLAAGSLEQEASETNVTLAGMGGIAWDPADRDGNTLAHAACASRQATIAGGTHEIQRNLLAERVLGLPRH